MSEAVSTLAENEANGEHEQCMEHAEIKEVRKGRALMSRRVTLGGSSEPTKKSANILFIHGSCAASSQWDRLIHELKSVFLIRTNGKDSSTGGSSSVHGTIECFTFDQLGCGESKHPAEDWAAYSASELLMDLETIARSILCSDEIVPLFIVAHSAGVSQAIKLINNFSPAEVARVRGVVFISGALKGGHRSFVNDDGHWIFRFPVFVLKFIQPWLSEQFVHSAILDKDLHKSAIEVSNRNDMAMCKAFYRQQEWATVEEARKLKVRKLLIG